MPPGWESRSQSPVGGYVEGDPDAVAPPTSPRVWSSTRSARTTMQSRAVSAVADVDPFGDDRPLHDRPGVDPDVGPQHRLLDSGSGGPRRRPVGADGSPDALHRPPADAERPVPLRRGELPPSALFGHVRIDPPGAVNRGG